MTDLVADPAGFGRSFAVFWGTADAQAMAALCAPDAEFLTLTGHLAEGREAIQHALANDLQGTLAGARLVSGKARLRSLGPAAVVLTQRYMLVGLTDADGQELGRIGAALTAVLQATPEGWHAVSLTFSALHT